MKDLEGRAEMPAAGLRINRENRIVAGRQFCWHQNHEPQFPHVKSRHNGPGNGPSESVFRAHEELRE